MECISNFSQVPTVSYECMQKCYFSHHPVASRNAPFLLLSTVAEHAVVRESLKLKVLFGSNLQLAYSRA